MKSKPKKWDRKAILGLVLLLTSFLIGAVLKSSAQISTTSHPRGFSGICDTYVSWLCVPTYYFSVPLPYSSWLVINVTSFLTSLTFFILGVKFVRE